MKSLTKLLVIGGIVFMCGSSTKAEASLAWDLTFLNDGATFTSTDTVSVLARVSNNSTDGETISNSSSAGSDFYLSGAAAGNQLGYTTTFHYDAAPHPIISPGESFDIILATYTPSGSVAENDYISNIELYMASHSSGYAGGKYTTFNWTVDNTPAGGSTVPEPATMVLFGSGMISMFMRKRRKV